MDELDISLRTILAYNEGFILNLRDVFDQLKVTTIRDPPTTKKGKEVDIKSIKVPPGTIISTKFGNLIKGMDRVPVEKYKFFVELKKGKHKFKYSNIDDLWISDDEHLQNVLTRCPNFLNTIWDKLGKVVTSEKDDKYCTVIETEDNKVEFIADYAWLEHLRDIGEVYLMERIDKKTCEKCRISEAHYGVIKPKKLLYCKDCADDLDFKYKDKDLELIPEKKSFPHQITINYAYKEGMNINMFLFRKNIKISGFQSEKYAIRMIKKFWKKHLLKTKDAINFFTDNNPGYIFESSMTNSSFETDYNFMLTKVNSLIHRLRQDDESILGTEYETTVDTGIKITLKATKPDDYSFHKITWLVDESKWEDSIVFKIEGRNKSTELDNKKTTIYLYDERIMISTRYGVVLKPACKFLTDILDEHREELEIEKIDEIQKYKPVFV